MSDTDIQIEKLNESTLKVHADIGVIHSIYEFFKFKDPSFMPNKYTKWDGMVRLFDKNKQELPSGLLQILLTFATERKLTYSLDESLKDLVDVGKNDVSDWAKELKLASCGKRITPYEYQIDALYYSIKFSKMTLLAATSAGKSLIIYMLCRYYQKIRTNSKHTTLVVVPSIQLVSQMHDDFVDYSTKNKWKVDNFVHTITAGCAKNSHKEIYISTWQSIQNEEPEYFEQFDSIIIDECHLSSGKKLQYITKCSVNAKCRIGMTGTLKDTKVHKLVVQGCFGPIVRVVTTKELQDAGRAADTQVNIVQLDYSTNDKKFVHGMAYNEEINFLIAHKYRNDVIANLAKNLRGNSLFLFGRIDDHQKIVFEKIKKHVKHAYLINGEVGAKERDEIKQIIESGNNVVLFASVGTCSTGLSIKKLHNMVFCHPTKSVIRVLQSVGRMLRLHDTKSTAQIFDLVDNLKYEDEPNYALKHAATRYGYYMREQHKTRIIKKRLKSIC